MEEVKTEHGVLPDCYDKRKDWRKERQCVPVFIGEQGRDIFNTIEWNKKVDTQGNQTEEEDITVKKLCKGFEEYCLPKENLVVERRK